MKDKILIVDDEAVLRETLEYNLKQEGYEIFTAENGEQALDSATKNQPHVVILDIMLPGGMDGFEVCRRLREKSSVPILMLTARDDEVDRVVGLEVGADDYLTKPFSLRELKARIKALLRRVKIIQCEFAGKNPDGEIKKLRFGDLVIDRDRHEVKKKDQVIPLKPKEYDLLVFLAEHKNKVFNRETILNKVWGWEYFGDSRTVDVHVRWLREKIEPDPLHPRYIITVRGSGYRFEG
jgi:DNA-binding response OmpR family regulator